jgi:hypothetical protein
VELVKNDEGKNRSLVQLMKGQYALFKDKDCPLNFESYQTENPEGNSTLITEKEEFLSAVKKMVPGDQTIFMDEGSELVVMLDEPERYSAWREGKLVLRNDPMALMLRRIGRWYNVDFQVTDNRIYDYTYWATFEEESLDEILKLLSMTGPVLFEKKGRAMIDDGQYKKQEIRVLLNDL